MSFLCFFSFQLATITDTCLLTIDMFTALGTPKLHWPNDVKIPSRWLFPGLTKTYVYSFSLILFHVCLLTTFEQWLWMPYPRLELAVLARSEKISIERPLGIGIWWSIIMIMTMRLVLGCIGRQHRRSGCWIVDIDQTTVFPCVVIILFFRA